MARVIFHAGTHKTGTTTIQSVLAKNRDRLAERGVYYPSPERFFGAEGRVRRADAHFMVADAVARYSDEDRRRLDAFVAHLRDASATCDTIVISAESVYRHKVLAEDHAEADERQARRRFVERLAKQFETLPLEFVIYFRRQDAFAESLYAEAIMSAGNRRSFRSFVSKNDALFDYRFQIDLFSAHCDTRVYCYEEKAREGLVESFFRDNGLGAAPASGTSLRPSVPKCAVRWLQLTKQERPLTRREQRRRWLFALQPASGALFRADQPSSFWRSVKQRDAFLRRWGRDAPELGFPRASPRLPPHCEWTDAMHRAAEAGFKAWQETNAVWILAREAAKLPPFAP